MRRSHETLHSSPIINMTQNQTVFLEPAWNLHGFQQQMIEHPPAGYKFVVNGSAQQKVLRNAAGWELARSLLAASASAVPMTLAKAWLQRWDKTSSTTDLTYAVDHLVFRPAPWVVEVEYATALVGMRPSHLKRFGRVVEKALASPFCRKILCWSEAGRRSLQENLSPEGFRDKIELVHYAVPPRSFVKQHRDEKVRLLFVGSGAAAGAFEGRGSEVFDMFAVLCQRYPNLELAVRSDVPAKVKARYKGMANLRIMDQPIPREALEHEYQMADVFLLPSYGTAPFTILEAMSYELPVVTIDSWANSEYVEDGKTGLVARRPRKVPPLYAGTRQPNFLAPDFSDMLRVPDAEMVADLASKVALLIDNQELRRQMGRAARWEVEHGKFSLTRMNEKLGRIFDEALGRGHAEQMGQAFPNAASRFSE